MPIALTNQEFLDGCFGPAEAGNAHVTGFTEDPNTLEGLGKKGYWGGTKWSRCLFRDGFPNQNSYFCVSVFDDEAGTGRARRQKALFRACHVVVVDDVGTKVPDTSRLPRPSWTLETSPGNYQWGYILATPETDAGRVVALIDGMIAQGLASDGKDPGMKGVTRYVRLPEGVNSKAKYGPVPFKCAIHSWAPERKFTMDELAAPWGIVLPAPGTAGAGTGRIRVDPGTDELLGHLDRWGLVLGSRTSDGEGFHITCPWVADHTDKADTGTAYWPGGGIECHHGHCQDKGRRELESWADARVREESGGLACLASRNFPVVPGYVGAKGLDPLVAAPRVGVGAGGRAGVGAGTAGTAGTPRDFFEDLIYVLPEDKFFSLATGDLVPRAAVDFAWGRLLIKDLPVVNARTGEQMKPSAWFSDVSNRSRARMADRITYWPGEGPYLADGDVVLVNKWVRPERMGLPVTDADVADWLALVDLVTSREGPAVRDLVLDWMALVVGEPGTKPGWHVVVQGGQGLGKDMIAQPLIEGVGRGNHGTVNAKALGSQFNPWAERRLVTVNELKQNTSGTATGADQYTTLKELTENSNDWIKINQKNMREYYARNVAAFYVTSNEEAAIALDGDDRRFLVVMAGDATQTAPWPEAEYARVATWMKEGGGAALCAEWLWQRYEGLSAAARGVLTGKAPGTAGKDAMMRAGQDPVKAYMREQIETGRWPDLMTSDDLALDLAQRAKAGTAGFRFAPSPHRVGAVLCALGGGKVYGGEPVRLKSGERARVWAVREPGRFAYFGNSEIAQAYVSAAGHAFSDGDGAKNVVNLTSK